MGDTLCDVSKEREGDGASQLDNTNDRSYPEFLSQSLNVLRDNLTIAI